MYDYELNNKKYKMMYVDDREVSIECRWMIDNDLILIMYLSSNLVIIYEIKLDEINATLLDEMMQKYFKFYSG